MCRYNEMTDEALIERLRAGESAIADYLMEKYKGLVRKKARAMFLIGGDTDDLIQEGMIGLFKAVRDYQPDRESSFQSFANICIDRQIYTAIKSSNRQKHQPLNTYVSLSDGEAEENFRDSCVELSVHSLHFPLHRLHPQFQTYQYHFFHHQKQLICHIPVFVLAAKQPALWMLFAA